MAGPLGMWNFMIQSFHDLIVRDVRFDIEECYDRRVMIHNLMPNYETQFILLMNQYKASYPVEFADSIYIEIMVC